MFNINKFSNYINDVFKKKTPHSKKKYIKVLQVKNKKQLINSFFLKKQQIVYYKFYNIKKYKFNTNINFNKTKNFKNIFTNSLFFFKNNYNCKINYALLEFYAKYFKKTELNNFLYYWLSDFFFYSKKPSKFLFTNKIKFFLNQRLVKQSVLLMYSNVFKKHYYDNSSKVFKYYIIKKKNNYNFFKFNILFIYPCFLYKNYLLKYNSHLFQFINTSYLLLMLI